MVTLSPADIQAMIESAVKGALRAHEDARSGVVGAKKGSHLDERHFRRMEKFEGVEAKWKEWSFQLKTQVGAISRPTRGLLDEIQNKGKDPDWDEIFLEHDQEEVQKMGAEIYNLMVSLMGGEALTLVRGVAGSNGWEAWHKVAMRFDPKTPARALKLMMMVMQPRRVKDIREMQAAVEEWENRVRQLENDHDIKLHEIIKTALLTSMLPNDFQDYVFQWSDASSDFKSIKDKVLALAMNRASLSRPVPMEVDRVRAEEWGDEQAQEEEWGNEHDDDGEREVHYVGEHCLRCGGHGHYARECPTPKGKGKGEQGKGAGKAKGKGKYNDYSNKGKGKGKYNDYANNDYYHKGAGPKGSSKGFGGQCWTCGEAGHRSNECPRNTKVAEIRSVSEEQSELNVGGVWSIGCVEVSEEKSINAVGGDRRWAPAGAGEITIDSAAEESVCPKDWGKVYPMKEPERKLHFTNASGGRMNHYGERRTTFRTEGSDTVMGMTFQASDVQKPLAAVWRIAEKGNIVRFGPREEDNFIENVATGKKIQMIKKGGSYVIKADFVKDEVFGRQAS